MPKRTQSYSSWQLKKLSSPHIAVRFLNAALADSREVFLRALRKVAQAHQMTKVAKEAGVQRETLYHALSDVGNPTLDTLESVLFVLGMKLAIISKSNADTGIYLGMGTSINVSIGTIPREVIKTNPSLLTGSVFQANPYLYTPLVGTAGIVTSIQNDQYNAEEFTTFSQKQNIEPRSVKQVYA